MPNEPPSIVIVGRPNVGKSTLFNRITGQRRAIVGDEPGITRDRLHSLATYEGRRFELIDTGGIVVSDAEYIPSQILKQARRAGTRRTTWFFWSTGARNQRADRELAAMLRKLGKPVTLASTRPTPARKRRWSTSSTRSGFKDIFPVSAEHGLGMGESARSRDRRNSRRRRRRKTGHSRRDHRTSQRRKIDAAERAYRRRARHRFADCRHHARFRRRGSGAQRHQKFVFIDTAGIRRKGKTKLMAEKLSVVMARRNIRMADVVIVVMDASEGVLGLDATIAGYAHEGGRSVILCVNKWDLLRLRGQEDGVRGERSLSPEVPGIRAGGLSYPQRSGTGVQQAVPADQGMLRIGQPASDNGRAEPLCRDPALRRTEDPVHYPGGPPSFVRPPSFVLFTDKSGPLHFSHERYLVNQLRKTADLALWFTGTPIRI
jgi:GTP-binding protein